MTNQKIANPPDTIASAPTTMPAIAPPESPAPSGAGAVSPSTASLPGVLFPYRAVRAVVPFTVCKAFYILVIKNFVI